MATITDPSLIRRMVEWFGLRAKTIRTSRNSVYPTLIVNPDNRPLPTKRAPIDTLMKESAAINVGAGGVFTFFTVPEGKRWIVYMASLVKATGSPTADGISISDGSVLMNFYKELPSTSYLESGMLNQPITMEAGWTIQGSWSAVAGTATCRILVEELTL